MKKQRINDAEDDVGKEAAEGKDLQEADAKGDCSEGFHIGVHSGTLICLQQEEVEGNGGLETI